jgi:parallel beta-helix repeat protein
MKKRSSLTIALIVFAASYASPSVINIPDDYPTIQEGLDVSSDGDTVLVEPGYYVENIVFGGHNVTLGSLFLTTGDSSYIWGTSIAGDSSGRVVSFGAGEDTTAMLIGFTVENGAYQSGGGIYCGNQSDPTIMSNLIMDNHAIPYTGGGIWCRVSNPRIIGNIIRDNTAESGGGGISLLDSNPLIKDNVIFFNSGGSHGGGILCVQSNPTILNNRIYGNYASYGGGIGSTDSDPLIAENLIYENVAEYGGGISHAWWSGVVMNNIIFSNLAVEQGGAAIFHYSNAFYVNNVIYGNESESMAGAISCLDFSAPGIVNTIIWDNIAGSFPEIFVDTSSTIAISYSDIRFGWEGEGNIDIDPLFRNAVNGDFHLRSEACDDTSNSPCIDRGSPAILDSLLDCDWGLETILSDMGAYGGGDSATVKIDDCFEKLPGGFFLFHNYPNPFNPLTTISYSLAEQRDMTISIYNLLGQRVATVFDGFQQAGQHSLTWDASAFPSGVYFARLEAGNYSESVKLVLLK